MTSSSPPLGRGPVAGVAAPLALLALFLCAASTATPALGSPLRGSALPADAAALQLLERASSAPDQVPYHGVEFVSAWSSSGSTSLVVDVDHRPGHGTTVRSASTVETPAADTFLPADSAEPSVLGLSSTLQLLAGNYAVVLADRRSVAGREADVVEARWPGGKVAARFWLDTGTGLVLRREVYDQQGRTTRASSFVEVEVGAARTPDHLPPAMPDAWAQEVGYSDRELMRSHGWQCPDQLTDGLGLVDARRGGTAERPILHLSYSDGLAAVSLFQQRGRLDTDKLEGYRATTRHGRTMYVRDGVPQRVVWTGRGTVFTVVADAPPSTVDRVVASLPHDAAEGGAWHRLGRGIDRVGSWFNPFG